GVYHYLPQEHVGVKGAAVELVKPLDNIPETVTKMLAGQSWGGKAQVILFFTCIPYRAEWRYSETAHRVILIDLGHAGQHVMLSATALGLGSCCLAAYDVEYCDEVLGVDGEEEFTIYAIPVGVVKQG
ncbi:MAG: SagB/ThcOx family dehydrogenase, partial [Symbiobacteriaceae bacterium]|nr:SagB/ThcOx family dehydrogenase [Symbiobacteriaceae bacterium]